MEVQKMTKYVQYKAPDQEALRDQINKARGEQTMAKFAETIKYNSPNIKVSASTLSRVCNWNSSTPVSIDLIRAIAAVADKDSGVTLESLAQANGMRTEEEEVEVSKRFDVMNRRRQRIAEVEKECRDIIQDEIMNRGYVVRKLRILRPLNEYSVLADRAFPRKADFGYSVSGMAPCNTWKFAVCPMELSENTADGSYRAYVKQCLSIYASVFASDSFEPEMWEGEKYSFIFVDEKLYHFFLDTLEKYDIKVNGVMTAILIEMEKHRVVDEIQLKRYDGEQAPKFFNMPLIQSEEDNIQMEDEYEEMHFDLDEEDD